MSDEKSKTIMTLPTMHYGGDMISPVGSAYEGPTNLKTELSARVVGSYFSDQTTEVMEKILDLEKKNTLSASETVYKKRITVVERLFDARADVKILFSRVSMHFSGALREKLFHQIDILHDLDDWEEGDDPIQLQSFNTFLRWYYLNKPSKLPNFGLSGSGHFIASWLANDNRNRLIFEFLSNDRIKWFVTKCYGDETDHGSGLTKLTRIADMLEPYRADEWFTKEAL